MARELGMLGGSAAEWLLQQERGRCRLPEENGCERLEPIPAWWPLDSDGVPRLGPATDEVPALDWSRLSADDLATLRMAIGRRTNAVVQVLINQQLAGRA